MRKHPVRRIEDAVGWGHADRRSTGPISHASDVPRGVMRLLHAHLLQHVEQLGRADISTAADERHTFAL
jgi:hypothetical protein